ncbi:MAG: DUF6179 domain-containing protein [Erysipelotrichaceae bacterium]
MNMLKQETPKQFLPINFSEYKDDGQLVELVIRQFKEMTADEISSISKELFNRLASGILYSCSLAEDYNELTLQKAYQKGQKVIEKKLKNIREIQKRILTTLFQTENIYYRSTVSDGIDAFLKHYNRRYFAAEMIINCDYPLFNPDIRQVSIGYIEQYLLNLEIENRFCQYFDNKQVDQLLENSLVDYKKLPINIFEPLLIVFIYNLILNKPPFNLIFELDDLNRLKSLVSESLIISIIADLSNQSFLDEQIIQYIIQGQNKVAALISQQLIGDNLEKLYLKRRKKTKIIKLNLFNNMDYQQYDQLLKLIYNCQDDNEVIRAIKQVNSLSDFIEILNDCDLSDQQLKLLVESLSLDECKIIMAYFKKYDYYLQPLADYLSTKLKMNLF